MGPVGQHSFGSSQTISMLQKFKKIRGRASAMGVKYLSSSGPARPHHYSPTIPIPLTSLCPGIPSVFFPPASVVGWFLRLEVFLQGRIFFFLPVLLPSSSSSCCVNAKLFCRLCYYKDGRRGRTFLRHWTIRFETGNCWKPFLNNIMGWLSQPARAVTFDRRWQRTGAFCTRNAPAWPDDTNKKAAQKCGIMPFREHKLPISQSLGRSARKSGGMEKWNLENWSGTTVEGIL